VNGNEEEDMAKTAIFLGGGASAAEGMPMQTGLISEYFKLVERNPEIKDSDMYREITSYFSELFGIDTSAADPGTLHFPTFEEAFGVLDLAVRRRETLKHFDLENISRNSNRIGFMRQYLVLLMAAVLTEAGKNTIGLYNNLINNLQRSNLLADTMFITTNYDTLIDNALNSMAGYWPDYGLDFAGQSAVPTGTAIKLYKVHGSLNWLYCPSCNIIRLTRQDAGVISLLTSPHKSDCEICESIMLPIIVPPTFFKEMSNVFLSIVWNRAEQSLREVEKIIFCGYSFADADMHVKYLIKRIQTNRSRPEDLRIEIINFHPGKKPYSATAERNRFSRFLGQSVCYTELSFADFTASPWSEY
jgi:NAD-dependent SIR2 family protein deacetylase